MEGECHVCGNIGFNDGGDGYFYCTRCNAQADDMINTCIDEDDLCNESGIYAGSHRRFRPTPVNLPESAYHVGISQSQQFAPSKTMEDDGVDNGGDGVGPLGPSDFGSCPPNLSYEDYYSAIRSRYVMGFQIMIQMQLKALVENFDVSPVIMGLVGPIWLRFLAYTRVMADEWADQVLHESETQNQGEVSESQHNARHSAEPQNMLGQRAVMIWYRSLRSTIPVSHTLSICFLICHLASEATLATDILKGALEGKIPYFSAFVEIEKQLGPPPSACPISSSLMFRPAQVLSLQNLEYAAAWIAQKISLKLPPVNFNAIASRYLQDLSLPALKILPKASRVYEWCTPQELYFSANELRLPSRVCVMSILIVAIRLLYNINGYGKWESTMASSNALANMNGKRQDSLEVDVLSDASENVSSKDFEDPGLDVVELLEILEAKYNKLRELHDTYGHSKGLASYLQHCRDIVFAGLEPSFEDYEEEKIIEDLWNFYQNQKGSDASKHEEERSIGANGLHKKRSRGNNRITPKGGKRFQENRFTCDIIREDETDYSLPSPVDKNNSSQRDQSTACESQLPASCDRDDAVISLQRDMEENKFCYIPPRIYVKKEEYLYYPRIKKDGAYSYAVHADYYILLRSCAKVAQVDARTMHIGVLIIERRLQQLEKRMNCCLRMKPLSDYCDICCNEVELHAANGLGEC